MNPDDFKRADLELLGYTGSVQDMEMAWLYDQGATTGNIKDRWKTYLTGLGYSGSLNDMFVAWLEAKGYSGPLNDLIREALAADNFYGVAAAGYTASATNFDGTNDYMTRGADLTGAADGKQFLFSCWININGGDSTDRVIIANTSQRIQIQLTGGNKFRIFGTDTTLSTAFDMQTTSTFTAGATWYHIIGSIDTAVANSGYIYVNDVAERSAYNPLTSGDIDYTSTNWAIGARTVGTQKINGCLSELYLEDTYLDLSVEANRRKFIDASGKPVDLGADGSTPTGASPLIYLPNSFGTFETNAGTGGNFTVTGALTECASSPSDVYTAYATNFDGTNDYMLRGADLTGAANGKQMTMSFWVNFNGGDGTLQYLLSSTDNFGLIRKTVDNQLNFKWVDSVPAFIVDMTTTSAYTAGATWYHVLISVDTGVANSGYIYVNDSAEVSAYSSVNTNDLDLTRANWSIGSSITGTSKMNACISEFWYEDTYLDLSTEANRRKFIDAWGNPVDLGADGSTPTGASPLVYLPNDSTNFETNAGTGGNFTVTGALTACADSPSD